jgi:uncharacterized membrane protein
MQRFNVWSFVCGVLQAAQQREEVVVVVGVVVVAAVVASRWSSMSILLIAPSCPSFAALVNHSRANSND